MMRRVLWVGVPVAMLVGMVGLIAFATVNGGTLQLIDSRGPIADAQRDTLYLALLIMSIIIVPVFLLTVIIAIRYRAGNTKATYSPEWATSRRLEFVWWGVPILIVLALSVIAWQTTHSLDPFRPIDSHKEPLKVQVIALQWKWLFLYPEQDVASVGELVMPVDRPVEFTITSDAPMNSFWIPQLGGQIYAMAGMSTKLHLQADKPGDYRGVSANLSGEGHADMDFKVKVVSDDDFSAWATGPSAQVELTEETYDDLRKPSRDDKPFRYTLTSDTLYDEVIARYGHTHAKTERAESAEVSY